MEKIATLRVLACLGLALAVAACASEGPNPRAANIAPPPPPPNPLQAQAPQQAPPQQQMVQSQQMTQPQQMQQQRPQQQAQAQPRGGAGAATGGLAMGGHLVSYKSMEAAEAGWQALVRRQPALQQLRPYFVPVLVRGEPWVRLVAGDFPDRDEVNRFCNWARAQQLYCAPMPLAGASLENPSSIMSGGGATSGGAPAAARQRQPRPAAPPQSGLNDALPVPGPAAAPTPVAPPVAAAPALVAPAANANNVPAQPLAPPLPPRRQATNPSLPQ
jgi:hypothetical protein